MSHPAVQAALFPGVPAARRGPADGRRGRRVVRRSPAKWPGPHTVDFVAVTLNRHTRTERTDHRGERGANLKTPRAGRLWIWRTCGLPRRSSQERRRAQDFDKPRCVRRRGPWVHQDLRRPARPRISSRQRTNCRCGSVPASGQTTADPAPAKNTGGGALAKAV